MAIPEISILVSTYRRPDHLARCLFSIALQDFDRSRLEVIVTDDGSTDATPEVVDRFARSADFAVAFVTHRHQGFRLARCRNEGVLCAQAPYLLFTDGDCIMPPNHVAEHLARRRPGAALAGDCLRLPQLASQRITDDVIRSGEYLAWVPWRERWRLQSKALRGLFYGWLRLPMRPRVSGNNMAMWRDDFEFVNGFDENYVGWGLEDLDLQLRLYRAGIRFHTILHRTQILHLWHPPHPTFARNGLGTANRDYFRTVQASSDVQCRQGLAQIRPGSFEHRSRSWTHGLRLVA